MKLLPGMEVCIKNQLQTELFLVKKVKENGYVTLDEYQLNKTGGG